MGRYSIKELEKLSGIKAHTIRIWEKRHRLIEPQRTSTNIRFYSDDDLKKIINVSMLNSNGFKISKIAGMTGEEMNRKVMELSKTHHDALVHIDQLVVGMVELDEEKFEKVLAGLVLRFGFEHTVTEIVYPFLEKIGVLWQTKHITPAQEHFISNLIRQKVIVAIDALSVPPRTAKKAMLFLPEHELHEIGLLFTHYRMRKAGFRTFYLGQAVPYSDVKSAYEVHRPDILVVSFTSSLSKAALDRYVSNLTSDFASSTILLAGAQMINYTSPYKNVHPLRTITDLNPFLKS